VPVASTSTVVALVAIGFVVAPVSASALPAVASAVGVVAPFVDEASVPLEAAWSVACAVSPAVGSPKQPDSNPATATIHRALESMPVFYHGGPATGRSSSWPYICA
jgi:hypothetical protein